MGVIGSCEIVCDICNQGCIFRLFPNGGQEASFTAIKEGERLPFQSGIADQEMWNSAIGLSVPGSARRKCALEVLTKP